MLNIYWNCRKFTWCNLESNVQKFWLAKHLAARIAQRNIGSWRMTYQKFMQITLGHVFKKHAHWFPVEYHTQQTNNVWMPQIGHQIHFTFEVILSFLTRILFERFHRHVSWLVGLGTDLQFALVHFTWIRKINTLVSQLFLLIGRHERNFFFARTNVPNFVFFFIENWHKSPKFLANLNIKIFLAHHLKLYKILSYQMRPRPILATKQHFPWCIADIDYWKLYCFRCSEFPYQASCYPVQPVASSSPLVELCCYYVCHRIYFYRNVNWWWSKEGFDKLRFQWKYFGIFTLFAGIWMFCLVDFLRL